jgi:uncharacterized protein YkwD
MTLARTLLAILVTSCLLQPAAAHAAAQAVRLSGRVVTDEGAPIPGAIVFINDVQFVTNDQGRWSGAVPFATRLRQFVTAMDYVSRRYTELVLSGPNVAPFERLDTMSSIFAPDVESYVRNQSTPPTIEEFVTDTGVARSQEVPAETTSITVSGMVGERDGRPLVRGDGYVERPDGMVDDVPISVQGDTFSVVFPIAHGAGFYRVEINDTTGGAVINVPVFVGVPYQSDGPIWPDDADLSGDGPVDRAREALAEVRSGYGLEAYVSDPRLDQVAQDHVDDMVANHWVCHCWADGSGVLDHVLGAGLSPASIPVPGQRNLFKVGVANAISSRPGASGIRALLSSPSHRQGLLGPYTHVGIAYGGDASRGTGVLSIMLALLR